MQKNSKNDLEVYDYNSQAFQTHNFISQKYLIHAETN